MRKEITSQLKGLGTLERFALSCLRRHTPGVIEVVDAASILGSPRPDTARLLSVLARKGWLTRVRRGVYIPVPLEATQARAYPEDPWVLASHLFRPCYIGGWSAAEQWDLTEQLFRTTLVVTPRPVRSTSASLLGLDYRIKQCRPHKFFGTTGVWRGAVRVDVSDLDKTIVDMMDDPSLGGGIRHAAEMLGAYWERHEKNLERLVNYAERMNNGAALKRLGYLAETVVGAERSFLESCHKRLTAGNAILDPNVRRKGKLVVRWRLWVNVQVDDAAS